MDLLRIGVASNKIGWLAQLPRPAKANEAQDPLNPVVSCCAGREDNIREDYSDNPGRIRPVAAESQYKSGL